MTTFILSYSMYALELPICVYKLHRINKKIVFMNFFNYFNLSYIKNKKKSNCILYIVELGCTTIQIRIIQIPTV